MDWDWLPFLGALDEEEEEAEMTEEAKAAKTPPSRPPDLVWKMPDNLSEMTDEERYKLAERICADARRAFGRREGNTPQGDDASAEKGE